MSISTLDGWKWETTTGRAPKYGMLQGGRGSVQGVGARGSTWVQGVGTLPQIPTSRPRVKSADAVEPKRLPKAPRIRSAQDRLPTVVSKKSVHWDPSIKEPRKTERPKRPRMDREIKAIDPLDSGTTAATRELFGL